MLNMHSLEVFKNSPEMMSAQRGELLPKKRGAGT